MTDLDTMKKWAAEKEAIRLAITGQTSRRSHKKELGHVNGLPNDET